MIRHPRALAAALALSVAAVLAAGCTPRAVIPDEERERISEELEGRNLFLRVSANTGPFFGDQSRHLLTDQPIEEVQLLESVSGDPISPPPSERVLLPGTRVRLRKVEFPTPWLIARRVVMTPRYHPWAIVEVEKENRPFIVVLPQEVVKFEQAKVELDRLFSTDDPTADLKALPREHQDAIRKRDLVEGMGTRGVEMAWGQPEKRRIDRPAGTEEWAWPGGHRTAYFKDDRLLRFERR
jgi:hypothetical protein